MELFVVDRYWGNKVSKQAQENDHLSKLLEKIEQRKKLKKSFDQQQEVVNDDSERIQEKRKKKKRKREVSINEEDEQKERCTIESESISDEKVSGLIKEAVEGDVWNEEETYEEYEKETYNENEKYVGESDNENEEHEDETDNENEERNKKSSTKKDGNEINDFAILGDFKFSKKKKAQYVLPKWLTKPSLISTDLKNLTVTVDDIPELDKNLVEILKRNNFTHFFPVQSELIPFLLKLDKQSRLMWPNDVCISAPTGSGKTLAFVLPIVQILQKKFDRHIRALVVLPVQDLAAQVARVFETFTAHTKLKVVLTTGSTSLQTEQKKLVRKRFSGEIETLADILVTTPGRLVEHIISTEGFSLKHLRFIVIDEADRVMDRIQHDWLYYLEKHLSVPGCPMINVKNVTTLPNRPQKLLYSATLSVDPEKLSQLSLMRPKLFTSVAPNKAGQDENVEFIGLFTTPAELTEYMTVCELAVKPLVLYYLLAKKKWRHVLIFTSSKKAAHKLAVFLRVLSTKVEHGFQVAEISSDFSITDRDKVLSDFATNKIDVLISTDKLSRGMDIPDVQCVISYDVPKKITNYIHRVGRTGRAGKNGTAVTIVTPKQKPLLSKFVQKTRKEITELAVAESKLVALESVYQETLFELKSQIDKEELLEKKMIKKVRKQSEEVQKILRQKQKMKKRKSEHQNKGNEKKRKKLNTYVSVNNTKKKTRKKSNYQNNH